MRGQFQYFIGWDGLYALLCCNVKTRGQLQHCTGWVRVGALLCCKVKRCAQCVDVLLCCKVKKYAHCVGALLCCKVKRCAHCVDAVLCCKVKRCAHCVDAVLCCKVKNPCPHSGPSTPHLFPQRGRSRAGGPGGSVWRGTATRRCRRGAGGEGPPAPRGQSPP